MTPEPDRAWALRAIQPIGLHELIDAVCLAFGCTAAELRAHARDEAHVVLARMVVSYMARELTDESFPRIGRAMNRDHTTIMTGRARIIRKLDDPHPRNDALRSIVIRLRDELSISANP